MRGRAGVAWVWTLVLWLWASPRARAAQTGELVVQPPWWAKHGAVEVDGNPAGFLPQKLVLPIGKHQIAVQKGRAVLRAEVVVKPGQATLLRWPRLAKPEARVLPAVALLIEGEGDRLAAEATAAEVLRQRKWAVVGHVGTLQRTARPADCAQSVPCLSDVAQECEVRFVLSVQLGKDAGSAATVRLFDGEVGDLAAVVAADDPAAEALGGSPSMGARTSSLSMRLALAFDRGMARPLGLIEVGSEPSDAEVLVDGRKRGQTPFLRPVAVGEHTLVVHKRGFVDYVNTVDVLAGKGSAIDVILRPDVMAGGASEKARPVRAISTAKR